MVSSSPYIFLWKIISPRFLKLYYNRSIKFPSMTNGLHSNTHTHKHTQTHTHKHTHTNTHTNTHTHIHTQTELCAEVKLWLTAQLMILCLGFMEHNVPHCTQTHPHTHTHTYTHKQNCVQKLSFDWMLSWWFNVWGSWNMTSPIAHKHTQTHTHTNKILCRS